MAADKVRTMRAAMVAQLATFVIVTGAGVALGFDLAVAIIAGVGFGALAALLIWAVGSRAEGFGAADEVRPVEPGFPGPPEHAETTDEQDTAKDDDG